MRKKIKQTVIVLALVAIAYRIITWDQANSVGWQIDWVILAIIAPIVLGLLIKRLMSCSPYSRAATPVQISQILSGLSDGAVIIAVMGTIVFSLLILMKLL